MKIFKIGFTAIIGILAMGLTIAAEAGAFKGTKLIPPVTPGCYRQVTYLCPGDPTPKVLLPDIDCPIPPATPIVCPAPNNTVTDVVFKVPIPTPLGNCPTDPIICCFNIVRKTAPATGFTVTNFVCGAFTPARK